MMAWLIRKIRFGSETEVKARVWNHKSSSVPQLGQTLLQWNDCSQDMVLLDMSDYNALILQFSLGWQSYITTKRQSAALLDFWTRTTNHTPRFYFHFSAVESTKCLPETEHSTYRFSLAFLRRRRKMRKLFTTTTRKQHSTALSRASSCCHGLVDEGCATFRFCTFLSSFF